MDLDRMLKQLKKLQAKVSALKSAASHKRRAPKSRQHSTKMDQWGFKSIDLGVDGFTRLFKRIGAPLTPRKTKTDGIVTYLWRGRAVTIIADDNPLTGEFDGRIRNDHIGYVHYMAVVGTAAAVRSVVRTIHTALGDDVEESPHSRDYI
jgi:hypothetical protein